MDGEILSRSHSRFLRRSPEKLQEGGLKRQHSRVRHKRIAKRSVCRCRQLKRSSVMLLKEVLQKTYDV